MIETLEMWTSGRVEEISWMGEINNEGVFKKKSRKKTLLQVTRNREGNWTEDEWPTDFGD